MATATRKKKDEGPVVLRQANIVRTTIKIRGTAPFVQNKFSKKAKEAMLADMARTKAEQKESPKDRPPRDYDREFIDAQHISVAGWNGIPCAGIRKAMIDACRAADLVMVRTKMSVFVLPDGFDRDDETPLVKIDAPAPPERRQDAVRNDNGSADIRTRAMFREWTADVTLEFDADMITAESVVNLLDRAGRQIGVGEGRPFSKDSVGQGWGTFTVESE